jgi:hypothetical protein
VRIHDTVADATLVINPKVNLATEYNHACMRDVHKREVKPKMANVLRNLVVPQKLAQIDLDDTKRIQLNQVFANPSKEEVPNPKIYLLTVKEIVDAYNAHAKLKTLL